MIRKFQATADALVALERVTAARDRLSMTDRSRLTIMRERFRGQTIAARAAADAAMTAFVWEGSIAPHSASEPRQMMLFAAG